MVQSAPALCRAGAVPNQISGSPHRCLRFRSLGHIISVSFRGEFMQIKYIRSALLMAGALLIFSLAACASRYSINGRVVDAETEHPIKAAAVAVRWVEDGPETNSAKRQPYDFAQDCSDKNGYFDMSAGATAANLPAVKKKPQLPARISRLQTTCRSDWSH